MRNHHIVIAGIGILWIVIDKYMFMKKKIKEKNEKIAALNKSSMENFQRTKEFVSLTNKYYSKIKEQKEEIKELKLLIECYEVGTCPYHEKIISELENKLSLYQATLARNRKIENTKNVLFMS
tara:strand:+ start:82 stop:450 length:369 start_codon:yes stop_codon:yes gene_type:complete